MSLVSDMLSKVKITPPMRETPPGLKSDINQARRKKVDKKYKIALVLSVVAAFMIIVSALLFRIYVIKAGEPIADDLNKLKSEHKSRTKDQKASETLSEKIEEALKTVPKKDEKPIIADKKDIIVKTPPPDLLTAALNESDKGDKEDSGTSESADKKPAGLKDNKKVDKAEIPPVEEEKEPGIGSKDTYHYLYKASRSEKDKDYLGAISIYNKILAVEPTNYIVMNKIASLLMKMNMWKESMDELRKSYKINKDYIPTLINIGIVYANTENYSTAEKYFQKALSLDPINQDAIFSIAVLYEKQNMDDKAAEYYSRLRKLGDTRGNTGLERILSYN
ncbi:MAG: tetratricopeptide repeat protein [Thermodesulfovibrionia bacterium]|nr:tetratricopeptide repeat protein [Thermodesulfovibrionia bacterium]